jgi:hypothetical protein
LQTATSGRVMTVYESVHLCTWNSLAPTGWIFMKLYILVFFKNL